MMIKTKIIESIIKQTKTQTNKHFYILNISAKSSQISPKFSGELSAGVPQRLKQKKQIYKQTNKQINILEPIYLSQIKSDLYEILRVSDGDPSATKWGPEGPPFGGRRPPALRRS